MRVLQVMECTIGGTRRHLRDLVLGLLRRGIEVDVACAALREPRMRDDMALMEQAGARVTDVPMVRRLSPLRDSRDTWRLMRLMGGRGFDVVHTHSSKAGALGRAAALTVSAGVRVHTPHTFAFAFEGGVGQGGEVAGPQGLIMATERMLGRLTHRMLHVSEGELHEGQQLRIVSVEKARVVPNGIDPTPFQHPGGGEALRDELGIPRSARLLGSVGLLNDAKGYDVLLDAVTRLPEDVHVLLVGHGEREPDLRSQAASLGLADRLHLAGWRDEISSAHDAMDVFVLSSRWEGMSYSLMEAMAAGLACVSTDVNGSHTLLTDGEEPCGLVVPREDVESLAAALSGLLDDPGRGEAFGRIAARRVADDFSLECMVDRTLAVYRELVT